jgi:hypothetical protein
MNHFAYPRRQLVREYRTSLNGALADTFQRPNGLLYAGRPPTIAREQNYAAMHNIHHEPLKGDTGSSDGSG